MSNFRPINRDTGFLLPPSVDEWLPERHLARIEGLFVQVLLLAREMGLLQLGTVALDGTKVQANASRHSALSYEHAGKIEAQLKAEVAELMAKAEAADQADSPDGMSIPDELARREDRLRRLAEARAKIEARGRGRWVRAVLQRPGGGHRGQSAGAGHGRGAGRERQAATHPHAGQARRPARG